MTETYFTYLELHKRDFLNIHKGVYE
nr:ribosomal protein S15 [Thrixspermum amplexicaule]